MSGAPPLWPHGIYEHVATAVGSELRAGDVRSRPTTPMPTSSVAIGGRCTRRHASQRQSPSGHRIGGGALLQSGEKALSTVFGGLFGLADQFVFGFTRLGPRIVLETRQGARRTQASQVISKSRRPARRRVRARSISASLIGCPVPACCSLAKCQDRVALRFAPTPERL